MLGRKGLAKGVGVGWGGSHAGAQPAVDPDFSSGSHVAPYTFAILATNKNAILGPQGRGGGRNGLGMESHGGNALKQIPEKNHNAFQWLGGLWR